MYCIEYNKYETNFFLSGALVNFTLKNFESPQSYYFLGRFRQLKKQYDLKIKEAELIESKLKQSTHHHQLEEVNALQKTVGT